MRMKEADSFMNRVRHALTLPLRTRCAELTVLFDRGSTLELQNFFPLLLDSIFGPQGTISWGLRTTTMSSNYDEDFTQLQHFLSPCGPVFKLIYTLLKDASAKYDFPLVYLPQKIQQILENSQCHPFYADLVHVNAQTKHIISLLLNPFDYYMFHFAYHLINPWHQRSTNTVNISWNTVYYVLCCDYMLHFFPTDPITQVLPVIYYNGKNPVQQFQKVENFRPQFGSQLINTSLLSKSMEEYSLQQNYARHPRNDIWRSETVLTVFIDMWLNNDQVSQPTTQINNSFNNSSANRILYYSELPSGEYMRIVRVLMKQLHAFSASAKFDDTHMSELKKIAIPMVQGKFYIFLRNLIHRWPLDGSFRLVLELWLTFIQPWRYPPNSINKQLQTYQNLNNVDFDEGNIPQTYIVDREYMPFIAENLLTYVVIFQQLLPRFSRVDLISPKMSVMLYRISKVFNQPNLSLFLQEVEFSVDNNHSPTHSFSTHWSSNLPPLNPTSNWCTNTSLNTSSWNASMQNDSFGSPRKLFVPNSNSTAFLGSPMCDKKWSAIVRQRIYELEGPNFCYKPLFSVPSAPEVNELILQVKKSIKVAQELVQIKQDEETRLSAGFWGIFKILWEVPVCSDEFSLNERMRVPAYLEVSLQNLMDLFHINQLPEECDNSNASVATGFEMSSSYKFLSPESVRDRIKKIKYEGDPDLHPIRTNEIKFLVRLFYQISQKLNEKYGQTFCELYYSPNYWGRLSRQILLPPITIYKYDKSKPGSPRVSSELPPRISFRSFASYSFVLYLIIGGFIAAGFGYNCYMYTFVIFSVYLMFKCLKALPSTPVRHNYPTQGFGNISFNDSF